MANMGYDPQMEWDPLELEGGLQQHFPPLSTEGAFGWLWLSGTGIVSDTPKVDQNLAQNKATLTQNQRGQGEMHRRCCVHGCDCTTRPC